MPRLWRGTSKLRVRYSHCQVLPRNRRDAQLTQRNRFVEYCEDLRIRFRSAVPVPAAQRTGAALLAERAARPVFDFVQTNSEVGQQTRRCSCTASERIGWKGFGIPPGTVAGAAGGVHSAAGPEPDRMFDQRSRRWFSDGSSMRVATVQTCPEGSMIHSTRSPQN